MDFIQLSSYTKINIYSRGKINLLFCKVFDYFNHNLHRGVYNPPEPVNISFQHVAFFEISPKFQLNNVKQSINHTLIS